MRKKDTDADRARVNVTWVETKKMYPKDDGAAEEDQSTCQDLSGVILNDIDPQDHGDAVLNDMFVFLK